MREWIKRRIGWYLDRHATNYSISWRIEGWKYNKEYKKPSGFSHDCPYCEYHLVICTSPKFIKCIYCNRRWKLEPEYEKWSLPSGPKDASEDVG